MVDKIVMVTMKQKILILQKMLLNDCGFDIIYT